LKIEKLKVMITVCNTHRNYNFFPFSIFNFHFIAAALSLLVFASCSGGGDRVSMEGRLLHMNQATFYVYSSDGILQDFDTINVAGGRFEYDREINHAGTLVIIFPNYSKLPIFVEPGISISINGDAARLREVKVKGGKLNEEFTKFREKNLNKTVAEMRKATANYVKSKEYHPEIALWLIQQHYLTPKDPDIKGAVALLKELLQKNDDNVRIKRLLNQLYAIGTLTVGDRVEPFTATDIDGNKITEHTLEGGKYWIATCASWSYESQTALNRLARKGDGSKVIAICLDIRKEDAKRIREQWGIRDVSMICDSTQWENPLLRTFGLNSVPDNVLIENGIVKLCNIDVTK
jgi:hypothetical protein